MISALPKTSAEILQRSAADPKACIWVAASAGTGKTKVLTDRILHLLLEGFAPERILCLTFTRAAAGEMANRLHKKLSDWATAEENRLNDDLYQLLGRQPSQKTIELARRLFIQVIDVPGGMKIQTIHGFCQSLLKRFPLEAGLSPHFTILDEQTAQALLLQAQTDTLEHTDDPIISKSLEYLSSVFDETSFQDSLKTLISERQKLNWMQTASRKKLNENKKLFEEFLGVSLEVTEEILIKEACEDRAFNPLHLKSIIKTLELGSKKDCERALGLASWLENPQTRAITFADYCDVFLTKERSIRTCLATQAIIKTHPEIEDILSAEANRLYRLCLSLKQLKVGQISWALAQLGSKILAHYQHLKTKRALLDYDDLIDHTVTLLTQPEITPWVLYKLDGGIDHILIDEAQDTNAQQWDVIARLAEEFFSGLSARQTQRTLFVVGDAKQSIYSFQGADPNVFHAKRRDFAQAIQASQQEWREVTLDISFRSTKAILDTVDCVFAQDSVKEGIAAHTERIQHRTHRHGHGGLVEIWPLAEVDDEIETLPWTPPTQTYGALKRPEAKLALSLAQQIHSWITKGEILPSKGRPIQPKDIMILMRRRCSFLNLLIKALKSLGVPIAGTDRMALLKQLAVMDLVAVGRFLLLQEDDLNLAIILKSPLIGLNEEQLFNLAYGREPLSLWQQLKSYQGQDVTIVKAFTYLRDLLKVSKHLQPYELFSYILTTLGGKKALIGRLGYDALDPLEEFMSLALAYQQTHTSCLQGFLAWLESGEIEIKRDMEEGERNEVRIMTVHAAKGLQAPIVFIPDTVHPPQSREKIAWVNLPDGHSLPIWLPSAAEDTPHTIDFKTNVQKEINQEYLRLLYVAMTRAEDRLYICGWQTRREGEQKNWYTHIQNALKISTQAIEFDFGQEIFAGWQGTGLRLSCPQEINLTPSDPLAKPLQTDMNEIPAWMLQKPPHENLQQTFLRPSQLHTTKTFKPFEANPNNPFKRGKIIHSLLEYLAYHPVADHRLLAQRFLTNKGDYANDENILNSVLGILNHPSFSLIFGPQSKAEVPIAGYLSGQPLSGQIDRLVVTESEVLIIDYKTDQKPARSLEEVPQGYIKQLEAYKIILADIYPHHTIRCAILWTHIPMLMELDFNRKS
ncbi:MAG: double-strand break repair helicase AddA [Alphaproteobacteria bacterium]|nr:double-strand break repair helicase AddA [Alphaproteobacteria bacterium]